MDRIEQYSMWISPNMCSLSRRGCWALVGQYISIMDAPPGFQNGLISGHCPAGPWNSQPRIQRTKSFVMNVSQTINPDQKVPWYSISLPCLLLKPEEYQTTRFIFVQVNKQLALPRHAATIATCYVCSMPPVLYIVEIGQIYYSILFAMSAPCSQSCTLLKLDKYTIHYSLCLLHAPSLPLSSLSEECSDWSIQLCSFSFLELTDISEKREVHLDTVSCNSWIQESSSKLSGSPQLLFWSFLDCIKQNTKQEYISLYIHSFFPLYFALSMSASAAYNGDIELSTEQDYCK